MDEHYDFESKEDYVKIYKKENTSFLYEVLEFDSTSGRDNRELFMKGFSSLFENDVVNHLIQDGFLIAPASTKYHGAYAGGLFDHSMNMARVLIQLTDVLNLKWERPTSPTIVGILHDLCKIDLYRYNREENKYEYNDCSLIKGHGIKSVIYATQRYGVHLTDEEVACIIYHMGAFTEKSEWNDYSAAIKKYPNVLWTHTADMVASKIQEV